MAILVQEIKTVNIRAMRNRKYEHRRGETQNSRTTHGKIIYKGQTSAPSEDTI